MNPATWDKAVRVISQDTSLYCTVHQEPGEPLQPESTQFTLQVLDPKTARAWSATFTARDINERIATEQAMDLDASLIQAAVGICVSSSNLTVHWEGLDNSSLRFECWFDTISRTAIAAPSMSDVHMLPRAVPIRLPPSGAMSVQTGQAYVDINIGVLSCLMQQYSEQQQRLQLLDHKLSSLQQHTQAVHDSYSDLASKLEKNELALQSSGGLAALRTEHVHKKQRTGHDTVAPAVAAATQQTALGATLPQATQNDPFSRTVMPTLGFNGSQGGGLNPVGFSQVDTVADAAADIAGANQVAYNRRQRQQQQTRQEAVRLKLLNEYKQLQQEWQGRLQQVLHAASLDEVEQQSVLQHRGSGRQNSLKQSQPGLIAGPGGSQQQQLTLAGANGLAGAAAASQGPEGLIADGGLAADTDEGAPELTAATARHVVRRSTRHANPLLVGRHRR